MRLVKAPIVLLALLLATACGRTDQLGLRNAWIAEAPPNAPVLAGYVAIHNSGDSDWTLTGARSAAFDEVQIHNMRMEDGIMHMRREQRMTVPAGGTLALEPHGPHLMLIKPHAALAVGDRVSVTLILEAPQQQRRELELEFPVKERP